MLENITIGQYYPGDSFIHKLDPRVKITAAFVYMVGLFVVNDISGYALVVCAGLLTAALSRIPAAYLLRGLRPVFILIVITFLLNMFLTPGEVLASAGPLEITVEGIRLGIILSVRLALLVLGASLVTLTTTPVNLTDGLERLLSPGKRIGVPAHELAMMMTIALRFIPTLLEEAEKIIKAQKARGADFEGGSLVKRARNLLPILVPLFVGAFRRADELAAAMEARGYRGGEGRTRMHELRFGARDIIAAAAGIIFLVLSVASRW